MCICNHYILKPFGETERNPEESDSDIMIKELKSKSFKERLKELAFSPEGSKLITALKQMKFFWFDAVVD